MFAVSLLFVACDDDKDAAVPFSYENTVVPTFTNPLEGQEMVFAVDQFDTEIELAWTEATYTANDGADLGSAVYSVSITYADTITGVVATTTDAAYTITTGVLNQAFYQIGVPFDMQNDVVWTITASLPNYDGSDVSSSVNTTVTSFDATTVSLVTAAAFTEPVEGAIFTLEEANAADTIDFAWTAAVYAALDGHAIADVEYVLSVANGDETSEVATATDLFFEITVENLNSTLKGIGLEAGTATEVVWTLQAMIPDEVGAESEVTLTTTVTVYDATPPANLWVPGAHQGWDPSVAPMMYETEESGVFTGYVNFADGDGNFKFTSQANWDGPNYGSDGTDWGLDTDNSAGNLNIGDLGNYLLTCNTTDLEWSKELRTFAMIGSFNGWAADEPLTWDAENNVFTATVDFVAGDEFKWRANADWGTNLGVADADLQTLGQDGGNIAIAEDGNYTVTLNLYAEVPTYSIVKN